MKNYGTAMVVCALAITTPLAGAQMTAPDPINPLWKCSTKEKGPPIYTSAKEDTLNRECELVFADWWPFTNTESTAGYYNFESLATEQNKWKMWFIWYNK